MNLTFKQKALLHLNIVEQYPLQVAVNIASRELFMLSCHFFSTDDYINKFIITVIDAVVRTYKVEFDIALGVLLPLCLVLLVVEAVLCCLYCRKNNKKGPYVTVDQPSGQ